MSLLTALSNFIVQCGLPILMSAIVINLISPSTLSFTKLMLLELLCLGYYLVQYWVSTCKWWVQTVFRVLVYLVVIVLSLIGLAHILG